MAEHCYAVSFMLSVTLKPFMLIVDMLFVVLLNVLMLTVVVPLLQRPDTQHNDI
jgi:hypothetical protein